MIGAIVCVTIAVALPIVALAMLGAKRRKERDEDAMVDLWLRDVRKHWLDAAPGTHDVDAGEADPFDDDACDDEGE